MEQQSELRDNMEETRNRWTKFCDTVFFVCVSGYCLFQCIDSFQVCRFVEMRTVNVIFEAGNSGSLIWLHSVYEAALPSLLARMENLWTICNVGHKIIPWSGKSLAGTKWKMLHKNKMPFPSMVPVKTDCIWLGRSQIIRYQGGILMNG